MKKAFTLMEVNLAMLIMAGGVLSVLGLYSLGYRESSQSCDDVASAAYAEAVVSPLTIALSATNLKWSSFRELGNYPSAEGWGAYINQNDGTIIANPESEAREVFDSVIGRLQFEGSANLPVSTLPTDAANGLKAGLVVLHERDSAIVRIGFRATKKPAELLSMPLYYTEVRFQGVVDDNGGSK
jgi:hypothetical protein